jgi:NADH-quinone oxidoreductase subunit F
MRIESPEHLAKVANELKSKLSSYEATISVCGGTGCVASGCHAVHDAVQAELEKRGLKDKVRLILTGCHGFCQQGPIIVVRPGDFFYPKVDPSWIPDIIETSVIGHEPLKKRLYRDPSKKKNIVKEQDIPFYAVQNRLLMGSNSHIDPMDIRDYIALGGYVALSRALFDMQPDEII